MAKKYWSKAWAEYLVFKQTAYGVTIDKTPKGEWRVWTSPASMQTRRIVGRGKTLAAACDAAIAELTSLR